MITKEKAQNLEKYKKELPEGNFLNRSQSHDLSTDGFIEPKKEFLIKEQPENIRLSNDLRKTSQIYTIEKTFVVRRFLQKHSNLIDVLLEAHPQIRKYFPSEKLRLKLYVDPESPEWEYLILSICTNPEYVDEAFNKLDVFKENWWSEASYGVAVNLSIDLEFE